MNYQWEFISDDGETVDGPPDRSSWILDESNNQAGLHNAVDDPTDTRWTTSQAQTSGQWLTIDLSRESSFNGISLNTASSPNDYPRGYQVSASNDGVNWGSPVATGSGSSTTNISFDDATARYIRIKQTGSVDRW